MKTIRNYIFWTYERGCGHYDIMVTLILAFIFIAPRFINFHDKPIPRIPSQNSEVIVRSEGTSVADSRYVYTIRAEDLHGATTDDDIRAGILAVVEPIAGYVRVQSYKPVTDTNGHLIAYEATVLR
ncbi:MAG: hypothetical protein ABI142_13500 [Bryocella sp.]